MPLTDTNNETWFKSWQPVHPIRTHLTTNRPLSSSAGSLIHEAGQSVQRTRLWMSEYVTVWYVSRAPHHASIYRDCASESARANVWGLVLVLGWCILGDLCVIDTYGAKKSVMNPYDNAPLTWRVCRRLASMAMCPHHVAHHGVPARTALMPAYRASTKGSLRAHPSLCHERTTAAVQESSH